MYVLNASRITLYHLHRVFPAVSKVAAVKQKAYISRVRPLHQALHFLSALDYGSHMMMEGQRHTIFL